MIGRTLRWVGALGIVAIAMVRCCVVFTPQLVFDADPVFDGAVTSSMGMAGSLFLDAVLIISCSLALLGEWRSGRGLDLLLLSLAIAPAAIIAWHGRNDAGDMWRGGTWLAATVTCATVAHLSRDHTMRIVMASALLAIIAPLLMRGATQLTWEHEATVSAFQQHKAEFLEARGWEPDSPAARIYERRLMHRQPTGWFTSTNIFGSVMGAVAIALAGTSYAAFRAWRLGAMQSGVWFLLAMLATICIGALVMTGSTGAAIATVAGALLLTAVLWRARWPASSLSDAEQTDVRWNRIMAITMLALVVGTTVGVVIRGAMLPEEFLGEKSLLFRWHYLRAALAVISEHTGVGVGPDGFQAAYTQFRPPRNPEEVQSAHAMFTDWLTTLGVSGLAWIGMIFVLVVRSAMRPTHDVAAESSERKVGCWFLLSSAALALVPAVLVERASLDHVDILLRLLAAAGYVFIAQVMLTTMSVVPRRTLVGILGAVATVLLVHGQIEMTFFQGGSVVWMMTMLGLLGGSLASRYTMTMRLSVMLVIPLLVGFASWICWAGAWPAWKQEHAMLMAARSLTPRGEQTDPQRTALVQRPLAADRLEDAYEIWPKNVHPLNAAADQLLLAARPLTTPAHTPAIQGAPLGLLMRAEEIIDRAVAEHHQPSSMVLAMNIHAALATLTDDADQWSRAIALGKAMTNRDPHGVSSWRRLGDVLWAAGAREEAAAAYTQALSNSDNFALDELKQLDASTHARIANRIAEADVP